MSRVSFLVSSCLLLAACQLSGGRLTQAHRTALQDSVRQTLEAYTAQVNALEWDAAIGYFADDPGFRWAEDGRITYPTYDSVVTTFNALRSVITAIQLHWRTVDVVALGPGAAAVTATFHEAFTDTAGTKTEFSGAVMIALRHQRDGWKFVSGHASSVQPRPE